MSASRTADDAQRVSAPQEIAAAMVEMTQDLLWPAYRLQVQHGKPGSEFSARVGWGRATYCRYHRRQNRFEIVYGTKMVQAKLEGPRSSAEWTTGREICDKGYFDGVLEPLNLFSQTVCHEFAHVLQLAFDLRGSSRVHNPSFYKLLTQLHEAGWAESVRSELLGRLEPYSGLLAREAWESREPKTDLEQSSQTFRPGMSVWFEARGRKRRGVVLRVNRNTVSIRPDKPIGRERYWRVRPSSVSVAPVDLPF